MEDAPEDNGTVILGLAGNDAGREAERQSMRGSVVEEAGEREVLGKAKL